jgi:membrane protein involved in colicin uptake
MSRIIHIKGRVIIQNIELAYEALKEAGFKDVIIQNNRFVIQKYDYYDGIGKQEEIEKVEEIYLKKFNEYVKKLEEEEKRRIEEEKRKVREEKKRLILENAAKQGYKLKKEITEDNKIKLVLQKRVY